MKDEKNSMTFSLHRYFIYCNKMRTAFDSLLVMKGYEKNEQLSRELIIYMSYWYAGLYVVIEGWKELSLKDTTIDKLLESRNVDLLRRYRNGVFHYQKNYNDKRFLDFMSDGDNCVEWTRELNKQFGRYFLDFLGNDK